MRVLQAVVERRVNQEVGVVVGSWMLELLVPEHKLISFTEGLVPQSDVLNKVAVTRCGWFDAYRELTF